MHEMALCESILDALEQNARAENYARVKAVHLEIGALAGVEIGALRFGFDVVMKDSLADGARLEIIEVPGTAWCMQCMKPVTVKQRYDECPDCGGFQLQVTGGEEMKIKQLEVD
jgi:hydrogenase nickel incorporation protein HypA/HybF